MSYQSASEPLPKCGAMCAIVPPHLLAAISASPNMPLTARHAAQNTLAHDAHISKSIRKHPTDNMITGVPLTDAAIRSDFQVGGPGPNGVVKVSSTVSHNFTTSRSSATPAEQRGHLWREVYDANHVDNPDSLPGILLLAEGENPPPASSNTALDSCYENFGKTHSFFLEVFGRNSLNGRGHPLVANIHYKTNYGNAFWLPNLRQMIFGDGGDVLTNLTSLDVIAHELTHGLTQYTAALQYQDQSGALNEHISDAFASMVKQWDRNQKAADADWLIGDSCLMPTISGIALRSLKFPGSAYDKLGIDKDPQPSSMASYNDTVSDNGGVHINSGIPNRAFYLTCVRLGGYSWEKAGPIWYQALTSADITPTCNFQQFADLTCKFAASLFGDDALAIVKSAWMDVGVYQTLSFTSIYDNRLVQAKRVESDAAEVFAFDGKNSGWSDHIVTLRRGNITIVAPSPYKDNQFVLVHNGPAIGSVDLTSAENWHGFAFDYLGSGFTNHLFFYAPGSGRVQILSLSVNSDGSTSWTTAFSSETGIGGVELLSPLDRALAFDFQHTGKLDHIVIYRPGKGLLSILRHDNNTFAPVLSTTKGLPQFNLSSPDDQIIAFDFEHIGCQDHLLMYRPGSGLVVILQVQDTTWRVVYGSTQANVSGIGGYKLTAKHDRIIAFDLKGTGRKEYLAIYRPGAGVFYVIEGKNGKFTRVYSDGSRSGDDNSGVGKGVGVGGFDLSMMTDCVVVYNTAGKDTPDTFGFYRPSEDRFVAVRPEWKTL